MQLLFIIIHFLPFIIKKLIIIARNSKAQVFQIPAYIPTPSSCFHNIKKEMKLCGPRASGPPSLFNNGNK